jgi:hypothetical protein
MGLNEIIFEQANGTSVLDASFQMRRFRLPEFVLHNRPPLAAKPL